MEKLSRRDFIKGATALSVVGMLGVERIKNYEAEKPLNLTYEQAITDAMHFSWFLESIPSEKRIGIKNGTDLANWTREIIPYFEYEKIMEDNDPGEFNGLIYPEISFEDYQDGLMHNHILGRTFVFTNEIDLNNRITNPISPWYSREDSIGTLVHELAHAQGVKFPAPNSPFDEESSAQLVTLEVLAAMANNGNELVVPALLDELRHMNMQAARFVATRDRRLPEFFEDQERILPDPFDLANARKASRMWEKHEDKKRYPYILEAYNYLPMDAVYRGFTHSDAIYGVKLPINWAVDMLNTNYGHTIPGGFGLESKETYVNHVSYPDAPLPLIIDDLHYFYDHAEEFTRELL